MKKLLLLGVCLIAGIVKAETNYVYVIEGRPQFTGTNCAYNNGTVTIGDAQLGGIDWTKIKVVQTTDNLPIPFTNINQVISTEILPGSDWKFNVRQTVEWKTLKADLDQYSPLMDAYTNSVYAVVDNKTKKALNDAKVLIKQLQQEIKDLKAVVGKLNQYE